MPIEITKENNIDKMYNFIKIEMLKAAEASIPLYKTDLNAGYKTLPKYILDLIRLRKTARKNAKNKEFSKQEKSI